MLFSVATCRCVQTLVRWLWGVYVTSQLLLALALSLQRETSPAGGGVGVFVGGTDVRIGLLLHEESLWATANDSIVSKVASEQGLRFITIYKPVMSNPINAALDLCEQLVTKQVSVLIITHPPGSPEVLPVSIAYTCSFYRLPIISIHTRDTIFSEKNIHPMFLRLVTPLDAEPVVWMDLLLNYKWRKAIIVVANDHNGNRVYEAAVNEATTKNIQLIGDNFGFYDPYAPDAKTIVARVLEEQVNIVLFYGSSESSRLFFSQVSDYRLGTKHLVWIVSSSSIDAAQEFGITGALAAIQTQGSNYRLLLHDAMRLVTSAVPNAINTMGGSWVEPLKECKDSVTGWKLGEILYKEMISLNLNEMSMKTGKVKFNKAGDRIETDFDIVNVNKIQKVVPVAKWRPRMTQNALIFNENVSIEWPTGKKETPNGILLDQSLKIVTMDVEPFVFLNPVDPVTRKCRDRLQKVNVDKFGVEVPCVKYNYTNNTVGAAQDLCCSGYSIDLLQMLSDKLNFSFSLHISKDGSFGNAKSKAFDPVDLKNGGVSGVGVGGGMGGSMGGQLGGSTKVWTGVVGELVSGEADLAVAPLTIDNERAQVIDFSNPFKHQGLSIMVKKKDTTSNLASFVQPFEYQLWILIFLSVHVVALIIYLLDRFSPFGNINMARDSTTDDSMTLPSALWFAWGVLLNSGIGEGTPNSFSARVLGMVWAGFAMVVVASYTANLAAFLVLDRPESEISGINDARMRNPSPTYKFGTVIGGATEAYFKRKVEMSNMYRYMIQNSYHSSYDAIQAIKNGSLQAFIWDSAVLDYEISKDCSLMTVGELFHRSGFGIGMPKNSPWREKVSMAVLAFHEDGSLEGLDSDWVSYQSCGTQDSMPATLGLNNMAGVFILVAIGIVLGIPVVFMEIAYKKQQERREKQFKLAKKLANQWRHKTQDEIDSEHLEALSMKHGVATGSVAETFEAPKSLPIGKGTILCAPSINSLNHFAGVSSGIPLGPAVYAQTLPNHKMVQSPEPQSKFTPGHKQVVPMTSLANHLSVVSSMSPHQGQVQGQIPGQQQQAVASSMCSLPQDPQQQVGVNRRATATPPMPPKRGTTQTNNTSNNQPMAQQTSINATTGGLGVATLPPNHTQPGQQQQQTPIALQASSFDSESSNASTQRGGYAPRNLYSPDFSPHDKFTSV